MGKIGLLEKIQEERKDYVVDILNYCLEILLNESISSTISRTRLSDNVTLSTEDIERIEIEFIPLILRTVAFVDISHEEIKRIYNDFCFDITKFMREIENNFDENKFLHDWETKYMCEYSDALIKRLQK